MSTKSHRPWGSVSILNDDKLLLKFTYPRSGTRYERVVPCSNSPRTKAQRLKYGRSVLRRIQTHLEDGEPIGSVLHSEFGTFYGSKLTFETAAPRYLEWLDRMVAAKERKPSTLRTAVERLRILLDAPWSRKRLGEISTQDLHAWVEARRKPRLVARLRARRSDETAAEFKGAPDRMQPTTIRVSAGTVMNDLTVASALFRWAIDGDYIQANPVVRRKLMPNFKPNGREVFLEPDYANALIDACSPAIRLVVLAAVHTGMRKGELLDCRWSWINSKSKLIEVPADVTKATRARRTPMTATLQDELDLAPRPNPKLDHSDHVFVDDAGLPLTVGKLRREFKKALANCEEIPLALREKLWFHDLRRSCGSIMVAHGCTIYEVSKILDHKSITTTMLYAHSTDEIKRPAIAALDKAMFESRERRRGAAQ